jgi:hypothetical protein
MSLILIQSGVFGLTLIVLTWILIRLERRLSASDLASRLEELRQRHDAVEESVERMTGSRTVEASPPNPLGPPLRRFDGGSRRIDPAASSAVPGPTLITVPSLAAAATPSSVAMSNDLGQRFGPIWDLADTGASPDAIARSTGQPIGQVELILALRRQLATHPGGGEHHLT